jgi:hypothetical protein
VDLMEAADQYAIKRRAHGLLTASVKSQQRLLGDLEQRLQEARNEMYAAETVLLRIAIETVNHPSEDPKSA